MFLLIKATTEMHERLEAAPDDATGAGGHARFWPVVAQIVVLDAVFSLDSVITAVGMVDEIYVMMAAVVVAVILMIVASKPLTAFVSAHPTLIILSRLSADGGAGSGRRWSGLPHSERVSLRGDRFFRSHRGFQSDRVAQPAQMERVESASTAHR